MSGIACLGLIALGGLLRPTANSSHMVVAIGHTLVTCSAFALPFSKSMRTPALLLNLTAVLQISNATYWSGGAVSPVLFAMPIAPILMGVIGRASLTFSCTSLALGCIGLMFYADANGYSFPLQDQPWQVMYGTVVWATLTGAGVMYFSERQYTSLYDKIETELGQRIQTQKALEASMEELEKVSTAKEWYLAYVSHELRNSLASVMASAELFDHNPNTMEQTQYASLLKQSGTNLASLLDDLLDYSSLEGGHLKLQTSEFDLLTLANGVFQAHIGAAHSAKLALHLHTPPTPRVHVFADMSRVQQILTNLVSNAIKYTDSGSVRIDITLGDCKGMVRIAVKDTGFGIPESLQQSIFEPYQRLKHPKIKGTGLGLAISKRLAEQMGSTLQLESKINEGSIFWMDLPIYGDGHGTEPDLTSPGAPIRKIGRFD